MIFQVRGCSFLTAPFYFTFDSVFCFIILSFHALCFPSITLQKTTPASVLTAVARIAGPTMAVGFTLPYWLLYATTFMGINCKDEIFRIKNTHISSLATPFGTAGSFPDMPPAALRSSSRFLSSSMAFKPAGVAAQPRPRMFAYVKHGLKKTSTFAKYV